jgi:hypothetical protein
MLTTISLPPQFNSEKMQSQETWSRWGPSIENHRSESIYSKIVQNIREKKHFSFVRLGDGDLKVLLGLGGTPVLPKYEELFRNALLPVLKVDDDLNLIVGVENSTPCCQLISNQVELNKFYSEISPEFLKNNSVIFMHIYANYGLSELLTSFENRNLIIVGPAYLNSVSIVSKSREHLSTKLECVWENYEELENQLIALIKRTADPVVLYACSIAGKMLISNLYFKYKDITQIDIGSALDPYAGHVTRPWQKNEL